MVKAPWVNISSFSPYIPCEYKHVQVGEIKTFIKVWHIAKWTKINTYAIGSANYCWLVFFFHSWLGTLFFI
jgi:hypothetical protein